MRNNERMRKALSILLCLCMLLQNAPVMAFAAAEDNLCEHHAVHTAECGYAEGSAGSPCTHEHSESCYALLACIHEQEEHECTVESGCIIMELGCHHVHGDCGYVEAVEPQECTTCQSVLTHAENCGYVAPVAEVTCACVPGEDGILVHTEGCGYVAGVEEVKCACEPTVTHGGEGCTYAEGKAGSPCTHTHAVKVDSADSCYKLLCSHKDGGHDDACGYAEAVEGHPCHYECAACETSPAPDGDTLPKGEDQAFPSEEGGTAEAVTEEEKSPSGKALTEGENPLDSESLPQPPVAAAPLSEEATGEEEVCNCGTDDAAIHATTCAVYVAPETAVCYCAEKCTEVNEWCDVCGFDYTQCGGTDMAVTWDGVDLSSNTASFGNNRGTWYLNPDNAATEFYNLIDDKLMLGAYGYVPDRTYITTNAYDYRDNLGNDGFLWTDCKNQTIQDGRYYIYVFSRSASQINRIEYIVDVQLRYTVNISVTGAPSGYGGVTLNGSNAGSPQYLQKGGSMTLTVKDVPSHKHTVTYDSSVTCTQNGDTYAFSNVNKSFTFKVVYEADEFATVSFGQPEGATISVNGNSTSPVRVIAGLPYTVSVKTNDGYYLTGITVDGTTTSLDTTSYNKNLTAGANGAGHTISVTTAKVAIPVHTTASITYTKNQDKASLVNAIKDAVYAGSGSKNSLTVNYLYFGDFYNPIDDYTDIWESVLTEGEMLSCNVKESISVKLSSGDVYSQACTLYLYDGDISAKGEIKKDYTEDPVKLDGNDFNCACPANFSSSYPVEYRYYTQSGQRLSSAPTEVGKYQVQVKASSYHTNPGAFLGTYWTSWSGLIPFEIVSVPVYSITVENSSDGRVTASKETSIAGKTVTLTIEPDGGYLVDTVSYNGTAITPVEGVYSFTMPAGAVTISATFKACTHETYENGICTLCGVQHADHTGGEATCTEQAVCTVCGASYGEVGGHTPGENADYTDNGNGEHSYTCTVCGTTVTEEHTYDDEDGTCACGLVKTHTITLDAVGAKIVEINGEDKEILPGGTFTVPHGQDLTVKFENTLSQKETGVYCDAWDAEWNLIDCDYDEATNTMTIPTSVVNQDFYIGANAYLRVQFNLHGGALTKIGEGQFNSDRCAWNAETSTLKVYCDRIFGLLSRFFQLGGHTFAGMKVDGSDEVVQSLEITGDMTVDILWNCDGSTLTYVPAKDATCMEAGNIAHYVCTCGKLYEDEAGTKELTAEEVKTNIDPTNHVGVDTATGKCACDYQFGFYVERDIEIDGIYHETYWFDNLSDALSYAHGSTDYGQYTTQSATVILHRDLTIEEGEIFSFQKQVVLDTNSFSVTNHGTLALEGYTYSTIPAAITGGTVKIGEKSYTWDSENNKWICAEGSHITELEENKATCAKAAICDLCGAGYGELDTSNHDSSVEFENGFCPNGCYEPAELVDGVYEISNAGQLYWFADKVTNENAAYGSADAILTCDIRVNEGTMTEASTDARVWTPIGKVAFGVNIPYTGTFEGNGKTVSGLYFNDTSANFSVGLFSVVGEGGTVRNVGIADSYLCGVSCIGAVAGSNYGTVTGCYNTGTVIGSSNSVGGVVGFNYGTATNCYNTGTVSGSSYYVGGVVGSNDGTVTDCHNSGTVSGDNRVGGVAGGNNGTVTGCYNSGTVSGTTFVGGVVGTGFASNCYNTGAVSGERSVGGVVGSCLGSAIVVGCYNSGTVSGTTDVGGVVGGSNGTVTGCYFDSTVYTSDAIGTNYGGTVTNVLGKSTEQFASGEVAYLLSQGENGSIWGQDLDNGEPVQTAPTFTGAAVYCGYRSCGDTAAVYTNNANVFPEKPDHTQNPTYTDNCDGTHSALYPCCGTTVPEDHSYENGKCVCGVYDLWVAGEQISDNHLTVTGDTGTATYDPATDTLTLIGFDNGDKSYSLTNNGWPVNAAVYSVSDLNVVLTGENRLGASGEEFCVAIQSGAALTIGGDGILNAGSIYSANSTTINGGTLNISGEEIAFDGPGTTINGGSVNVSVFSSVANETLTVNGGRAVFQGGYTGVGYGCTILIGEGMAAYDKNGRVIENPDFKNLKYALIKEAHVHSWTYTAEGDTITAICEGTIGECPEAEQSITIHADGKTYDGTPVTAELEGSIEGVADPEIICSGNTNVGTYTASIKLGKATASVEFTIDRATPTVAWDNTSVSVDYTGAAASITAPTVTLVNGETFNGSISYSYTGTASGNGLPTNAGTYEITASIGTQGNYNAATSTNKLTLTIHKTPSTITKAPEAIEGLKYNGQDQALITPGKAEGGKLLYSVNGSTWSENVPTMRAPDKYDIYYKVEGDSNHTDWDDGSGIKFQVTIGKADMTVTAEDQTITYGEAISADAFTADDLVDGHTMTVKLTPSTTNVTVSGTITASAAVISADDVDVTGNYNVSYTSGKLVIKPDTAAIDDLTGENVTSDDEEAIQAVQEMLENADSLTEEWEAIGENCETLLDKIEAVEAENDRIADAISGFDLTTVKSSDEEAIAQLISDIDDQLATDNLTDEERSELEGLKTKGENLIAKIDGTETLIGQLDKTVDDLDAETVKSTDKATLEQVIEDAQTLIDSGNVTDAEKETLVKIQEDAEDLIQVVEDTAAENQELTDQAAAFDEETVNSTDKENLEQLAEDIEALLDTDNLTEGEREALETVLEQVEGMIDTIEDTAEDSKAATGKIDALDPAAVTSDDKDDLEQAIETIDELLKDDHLTEEERSALEDAKADAEALIEKIEAAQDAADTENTEKVEDVTADNVKPEDKEALEDAKADLEKALEDNAGNYTEEEKQAIRDELQRIEDAVEALENAEDVTDSITRLPDTVEPDDEEAREEILDAKDAYDKLTDHEKSLLEEDLKEKLEDLVAALTDYKIIKGNGGKWHKGSSYGLSFTANGPLGRFTGIQVDGRNVSKLWYEVKSGSTVVTLKRLYLGALSVGSHTITVNYSDGQATGTFHVLAREDSPGTGDDTPIEVWIGAALGSLLCVAVLLLNRKKFFKK